MVTTVLGAGARVLAGGDPASADRLRRFNDLKFGMFIHWGPYSLASVEASWPRGDGPGRSGCSA
jgi:hypothetical protein